MTRWDWSLVYYCVDVSYGWMNPRLPVSRHLDVRALHVLYYIAVGAWAYDLFREAILGCFS